MLIHEVTSSITFDCRDNYPDSQQNTMCKLGSAQNEKCMWNSRGCICCNVCHKNHLLKVSLKRKTDNISSIIWRMTAEKRARAIGIPRQGAGIWQVRHFFFQECYKSRSPTDKCRSLRQTKQNSSFSGRQSFRTPAFNDRGPMQIGNVIDTYCY